MDYLTREEAIKSMLDGKRVQFHWKGKVIEVTFRTTLEDLRWALMARTKLLVSHVMNGNYSII